MTMGGSLTPLTWSVVQLLCVFKCLGTAHADNMGLGPPEGGDGTATTVMEMKEVLVQGAMVSELTQVTFAVCACAQYVYV